MTKKSKSKKSATKKPAQLKIDGTGRLDANEAVEEQSEKVRRLTDKRMATEVDERIERAKLTDMLKEFKLREYIYEDEDGEMRRAFVPKSAKEPQAKVQKLKRKTPEAEE